MRNANMWIGYISIFQFIGGCGPVWQSIPSHLRSSGEQGQLSREQHGVDE